MRFVIDEVAYILGAARLDLERHTVILNISEMITFTKLSKHCYSK